VLAARLDSMGGDCRGARVACSLQLDGELAVRGRERLARHLRCCDSCRSFARDIAAISKLLRAGRRRSWQISHRDLKPELLTRIPLLDR
jgi:predicted anti-sigma-YlaC factor YlaD